ncbi:MAG: hypothetical protein N2738_06320 [Thermodesulfovibrionales bacterium]|nr:hypothetical protein [Thermodesulfovibrionales bacterium]
MAIKSLFISLIMTLLMSNSYVFASDFTKNIRVGYDPDIKNVDYYIVIEKDENLDKWILSSITLQPIKKEKETQESFVVKLIRASDAIYVQPFYENDEEWALIGEMLFKCNPGEKKAHKFTPCNSKFTTFKQASWFFLGGASYRLSKDKVLKALQESEAIQSIAKIKSDEKDIENKDERLTSQTEGITNTILSLDYDGVYIMTAENKLLEVPIAQYNELSAADEISTKFDKAITGGASKISISFETDFFQRLSKSRFKAIVMKGIDPNSIELKYAKRNKKLFSYNFTNTFKFYPAQSYSLNEFKRKTIDNFIVMFEPISLYTIGDASKGEYLLIAQKNRQIPWSSLVIQQKGIQGFVAEKPTFWLIGLD